MPTKRSKLISGRVKDEYRNEKSSKFCFKVNHLNDEENEANRLVEELLNKREI